MPRELIKEKCSFFIIVLEQEMFESAMYVYYDNVIFLSTFISLPL